MSPRSRSRSPRSHRSYSRSYSRSPGRYNRRNRYASRSRSVSSPRHPPPPPPKLSGRYSERYVHDIKRSVSPRYRRNGNSNRRQYSRSNSRHRSRSRSFDRNNRGNREKTVPCRCIGVFGLSVYTTQQKIREIFSKYGPIDRIQVVVDSQTGRSRGFCFIYYEHLADAKQARDNTCGMEIDGRRIRVAYSITERPHTPTPGVYKGRSTRSIRSRDRNKSSRRSPSPYSSKSRVDRRRSPSYSPRQSRY